MSPSISFFGNFLQFLPFAKRIPELAEEISLKKLFLAQYLNPFQLSFYRLLQRHQGIFSSLQKNFSCCASTRDRDEPLFFQKFVFLVFGPLMFVVAVVRFLTISLGFPSLHICS